MTVARNTRDVASQRRVEVLRVAARMGGWTARPVIEWILFPDAENRRLYANRLITDTIEQGWLHPRPLPDKSHMQAVVLTRAGAFQLESPNGSDHVRAGTSWGEHIDGVWHPPKSWRHDLRAASFVTWAAANRDGDWRPLFEYELAQLNDYRTGKSPDGLLLHVSRYPKAMWVECEQSRKTGDHRNHLIEHMARMAAHEADLVQIPRPNWPFVGPCSVAQTCMIVLPPGDDGSTMRHACERWLARNPGRRLLWHPAFDLGAANFRVGPIIDLRSATDGKVTQYS